MFDSIGFNNYKSFSSKGEKLPADLAIRRLTLLYGYNNSGKSALARGCCMANRSLAKLGEPLDRSLPVFSKHMRFEDVLTQESRNQLVLSATKGLWKLRWEIRSWPDGATYKVERFALERAGMKILATWQPDSAKENEGCSYEVVMDDVPRGQYDLHFMGLVPTGLEALISEIDSLREQRAGHVWLPSNRKVGPRFNEIYESEIVDLDQDGTGCAELLYQAKYRWKNGHHFLNQISGFFTATFHQSIEIELVGRQFEVKFQNQRTLERVNACDVGQGLQELLPIITFLNVGELSQFDVRSVTIEEPESHLHPIFHAALGGEICRVASQDGPSLIIETHSQNLMLSVQIAIASGRLRADDVVVYWVRADVSGRSLAECVTFDDLGRPSGNWPPDVFSSDVRISKELLSLQMGRK